MSQKYRDLGSRAAWTALQAALSVVTVEALGIPLAWAPILAVLLSAFKSFVATKVGNPDTVTFTSTPLPPPPPAGGVPEQYPGEFA
jgi:hypothetical protein